jgi:hypothetical protein
MLGQCLLCFSSKWLGLPCIDICGVFQAAGLTVFCSRLLQGIREEPVKKLQPRLLGEAETERVKVTG